MTVKDEGRHSSLTGVLIIEKIRFGQRLFGIVELIHLKGKVRPRRTKHVATGIHSETGDAQAKVRCARRLIFTRFQEDFLRFGKLKEKDGEVRRSSERRRAYVFFREKNSTESNEQRVNIRWFLGKHQCALVSTFRRFKIQL